MTDWALIIGAIGAGTGIFSLVWHISNSRSRVVLDVNFHRVRDHPFSDKEVIAVSILLKNKSNRSTTIEDVGLEIGNHHFDVTSQFIAKKYIGANSSEKFDFRQKILAKEFNEILEIKPVRLGITIHHTFGKSKKEGLTDFSSDYLSL